MVTGPQISSGYDSAQLSDSDWEADVLPLNDPGILAEDAFGNTLSGRPRYKVKDGDVYETDALGHVLRRVGKVED